MSDLTSTRALVTGASSGIGMELARLLAKRGASLTLTARRQDRLDALAEELRAAHGISVRTVSQDLAHPAGAATLADNLAAASEPIDILINNAGFGDWDAFAATSWTKQLEMLQLNILSLVELTHRLLPDMLRSPRRSYIMNIASIAAFQPTPYFASYGATKAYVRSFSGALGYELQGTGVSVTCVCPGGTATEFMDTAGMKRLGSLVSASMMEPERVAVVALAAMLRGRAHVTPGWLNKLTTFLTRLTPRPVTTILAARLMGRPPNAKRLLAEASK